MLPVVVAALAADRVTRGVSAGLPGFGLVMVVFAAAACVFVFARTDASFELPPELACAVVYAAVARLLCVLVAVAAAVLAAAAAAVVPVAVDLKMGARKAAGRGQPPAAL